MYQIFFITFSIVYLLLPSFTVARAEYTEAQFKDDWAAPWQDEEAKNTLYWGGAITGVIVLGRESFADRLQEDMAKDKPLGDSAIIGDYMGQLVPNLGYMSYMFFKDDHVSHRRAKLMFKVSAFSGLTTFFLKRIVNQKRPSGSDRNSFPSGHTTTAFAFAGVVALEHPQWRIPAYALASFVGLSRMNDNAHYLHDVTMGATIGLVYAQALYNKQDKTESVFFLPYADGALVGIQNYF